MTGGSATFSGNLNLADNKYAYFGNSNDLEIYHDGVESSYIKVTAGDLYIRNESDSQQTYIQATNSSSTTENYIKLDGAQEITEFPKSTKHMDSVHSIFGNSSDASIYHDGSTTWYFLQQIDNGYIDIRNDDGSGGTTSYLVIDGNNELNRFYKRVQLEDNVKLTLGNITTPDLEIYHDGSHSYISDQGTGHLQILTSQLQINNAANTENMATFAADGSVSLYNDGTVKLTTTSTGADIDGTLTLDTLAYGASATTALSFGINTFSFANASGTIISCNSSRTVSINEGLIVSGISSDADITITGANLNLNNNANILLDPAVSSGESSGTIIKHGAHMSDLVAGNIYYAYDGSGSLFWGGADADSANTEHMIALSLGTDADVNGMLLNGIYHKASHGFTVGDPIYLSTTPMAMTNTAPSGSGDYVRVLGYAIDSNHIYFCPDNTWVKID